jgi:peptidoglycan/LPS O-acetylase OafA/YrhL
VAFLLLGAAVVVSRLVPSWLGVLLVVGGLLSLAIGFSIGYQGLESGFQDAVGIALQLVVLVFGVGLLVVSRRAREPGTSSAST